MNKRQLEYLMTLVRMDIRKKERGLAKLAPKPKQSAANFEAFETHATARRNFAVETFRDLQKQVASARF